MGLLAAFQASHRPRGSVAFPAPQWDYDPRNISPDTRSWPNAGTRPGHGLAVSGRAVVEPRGGPNAGPCVSFPDGGFYDGTVELGIVGNAPRTHLVLFESAGTNYIELMGWGYSGYYRMYDSMIYANHVIQHFWGYQDHSGNALRVGSWNAWLVRAAPRTATDLTLSMWLNDTYSQDSAPLNTGASPLRIGSGHYRNYAGDRKIARVLIWDRALTDAELGQVQAWVTGTYGLACGPPATSYAAYGAYNAAGYYAGGGFSGINPQLLRNYPA